MGTLNYARCENRLGWFWLCGENDNSLPFAHLEHRSPFSYSLSAYSFLFVNYSLISPQTIFQYTQLEYRAPTIYRLWSYKMKI